MHLTPWRAALHAVISVIYAAFSGPATATSLDMEKLKLLSCVLVAPAEAQPNQRAAMRWIYAVSKSTDLIHFAIPGPVAIGKACLKNVSIVLGKEWRVDGDICSERIEEFSAILGDIGVKLEQDAAEGDTAKSLIAHGFNFRYQVARKTADTPASLITYTFNCMSKVPEK